MATIASIIKILMKAEEKTQKVPRLYHLDDSEENSWLWRTVFLPGTRLHQTESQGGQANCLISISIRFCLANSRQACLFNTSSH